MGPGVVHPRADQAVAERHLGRPLRAEELPRGDVGRTARLLHLRPPVERIVHVGQLTIVGEGEAGDGDRREGRVRDVAGVPLIRLRLFQQPIERIVDRRHVGIRAARRILGEGCPREAVELERLSRRPAHARGERDGHRRLPPERVERVLEYGAVFVGVLGNVPGFVADSISRPTPRLGT